VPTKTPNGFAICSRAKPPIVDGRQQWLSASDNAFAHLLILWIGFGVMRVCARRVLVNRVCRL
jgi:hypothetical protein